MRLMMPCFGSGCACPVGSELSSVRAACRARGIHHSTYYRWRRQVELYGAEVLRPRHPLRAAERRHRLHPGLAQRGGVRTTGSRRAGPFTQRSDHRGTADARRRTDRGHGSRRAGVEGPHLVFPRGDGTWWNPPAISLSFARAVKVASVPRIRLHDVRRSHASLLLAAGVNPKVVSERLGHSSVAFTLNTYAHVMPGMQPESAELFDRLVFGSAESSKHTRAEGQ